MYKAIISIVMAMILSACGDGINVGGGIPSTQQGVFLDAEVEGLRFVTASGAGNTDSNGAFAYRPGETISFFVGDILVGSGVAKAVMTPLDLVPGAVDETNPQVTNITRFLLTLDADGIFSNGIQIDSSVISAAASQSIDFSMPITAFENDTSILAVLNFLTQGLPGGAKSLVTTADAQAHFLDTLNDILSGSTTTTPGAPGTFGSVSFSGIDAGVIGSSYTPIVSSDLSDAATTLVIWNAGTGSSLSITVGNGSGLSFDTISFTFISPSNLSGYSYSIACFVEVVECAKLVVDVNAKSATFNNLTLPATDFSFSSTTNASTGPLTINGTLTW